MRNLAEFGLDALAVLNESPSLTYICSVDSPPAMLFVSNASKTLLGYAPEDFVDTPGFLSSLVHPDDVETMADSYRSAHAYGSATRDRRLRVATGEWRWFRDNFRIVVGADGKPAYGIGSIFDVTDEKSALLALEARTSEYRILADHSSDLISRITFDGRFVYQSPSASRVMGFEADARRGQSALGQIHTDDLRKIEDAWRASYRTREAQTVVYRAFHAEGRWVTLEAVMNPVVDPATNKVAEFVIVSRDVTERMEAQRRLAEAQAEIRLHAETYELFAEHGCDYFLRLTLDGRMTHVSPSHERILGRQPLLREGKLAEVAHPDDVETMRAVWRQAMASGEAASFRARVQHEDGHWVWTEARLTPIRSATGELTEMIAVCRDVSEQVAANEALKAANRQIEEQGELYDLFANRGSEIFLRFDIEGNVRHVSSSHERILGRDTLTRDGKVAHMVHPDDMALATEAFRRAYKAKSAVTYRHRYKHENGSWVWLEVSLTPLVAATGEVAEYIAAARDVTGQVEAEKRLETAQVELDQSRAQLRLVTDNIADVITMIRPDGTIAYMSPSVGNLVGYSAPEMMSKTRTTLVHPDDFEATQAEVARNRLGEVTPRMRYRVQHRDGSWIWVERRAGLVRDASFGEGAAILSVLRDVTADVEREKQIADANAALERSRKRLQLVTDNMEDVVALFRPDGGVAYMSPSAIKVLGYPAAELASVTADQVVHPDDRAMFAKEMTANRKGYVTPLMRYRMIRKDGRVIWIERRANTVQEHDFGEGVAVLVVSSDVTAEVEQERHIAEAWAAHEESHAKLRTIMDNSVDVIAVFSAERKLEYLSRSCRQQSGYDAEDFLEGRANLTHPDDESIVTEALERENAGGDGETFRYRGVRKDGGVIWLERRARKVYDAGTGALRYIITVTRDISEEVKHERDMTAANAALEKAKIAAEVASVTKSQFLAAMSHELRTPMTGVMGMLDLLKGSSLDADQGRFANIAYESAENLLTILNDILDFSKIEAGQLSIDRQAFGLRGEIDKVTSLLTPVAQRKGNTLRAVIDAGVPDRVVGDPSRLRQVLFNLVGNAIKFTAEGLVSITVKSSPLGVRFEVRDTGAGIPADAQAKLFQPFVQADGSASRKAGGTGLGLAISKSLIEAMNGSIGMESVEGRGSLFWFELPFMAADRTAAAEQAGGAERPVRLRRRFDILVAEDHPVNQQLIAALLKREGHAVTIVGNGALAVDAVQQRAFDLVLMDVQMPVLDGTAATRAIRALPGPVSRIPIVAITANALRGDMEAYLAAGMTGYVSKPIRIEALRDAMDGAVPISGEDGKARAPLSVRVQPA